VGASPSAWAGGPLLPPAFGGEGRSPALRGRRTLGTRGWPSMALSAATCLAPRPRRLWCRLRRCLLPLGRSVAARPPHGRRSRCARVGHIHGFSCTTSRTGRSYKTSYAVRVEAAFLDGLVLTPVVRTGAKTSSCALVQPLPIGAEVVAATGGADVAASAGEAAHCRGGCLRWRDRQCHLLPDPRLFGFNGLAVTPRRKTGARTYSQQRSPRGDRCCWRAARSRGHCRCWCRGGRRCWRACTESASSATLDGAA
jgi:hypothetical protein